VAGGETLRANLARHAQKRLELYVGVAIGAGDGRTAGKILIDERTHHALLELLLEIYDVMWKIQVLRDGFGVVDIVEGTATVLRGAVALKFGETALVPQLHREAYDGAALLLQKRRNSGRVDTTRHGDSDEAELRFGALGQGVELGRCCHIQDQGTIYRAPT